MGKDSTWLSVAQRLGFERIVPYTTRPIRDNEIEGLDHQYVSIEDFQRKIRNRELLEWDYVLGNYYGTDKSYESRILSGENFAVTILARMAIRLKMKLTNVVSVLLLTSDSDTLADRLEQRGYRGNELLNRSNHGLEEEAHAMLFDLVVADADILSNDHVARILTEIIEQTH